MTSSSKPAQDECAVRSQRLVEVELASGRRVKRLQLVTCGRRAQVFYAGAGGVCVGCLRDFREHGALELWNGQVIVYGPLQQAYRDRLAKVARKRVAKIARKSRRKARRR